MDADDGVGFVVEGETGSSKMQHGVNRPLWGERYNYINPASYARTSKTEAPWQGLTITTVSDLRQDLKDSTSMLHKS